MKRIAPKLLPLLLLLVASICFFSLKASRPHTKTVESCGERLCCKTQKEASCNVEPSGTEFGVFDAGNRLFSAKI